MKNTIFAMAIMAVMISFTSCGSNSPKTETPAVDLTSVTDSTSHETDTTSVIADSTSVK
jgi:predicted small lipoprotein YifL